MGNSPDNITMLERRIVQLESQIQEFEKQLTQQQKALTAAGNQLPDTSLLSPSFLTRAFAVWGHMIVAQLLIVVPLYCLIFLIGALGR